MRFPFRFYKAGPTDLVAKFVGGKRRRSGTGIVVFVTPWSTVARVATTDQTVPFAFTELTGDGQQIFIQGELQVKLDADTILARRDFTIDPESGEYISDDPDLVNAETSHALQSYVRRAIGTKALKEALAETATLERTVLEAIKNDAAAFSALGVKVVTVFVTAVAPANPDLKKALEAEAREKMLAAADKALAERRHDAAKSDRTLKEYEADTAKLLEERRTELVTARNGNLLAEAAADAEAAAKRIAPYRDVDPRTLLALGIRDLSATGKVGQVNFTPDFLAAMQRAAPNGRE